MIKGRVVVNFPASVDGTNGISVTKANGAFTIASDWSDLAENTDVTGLYIIAQNPETGVFYRVPLSLFALAE